ncbi:MAG: undecaprenyl-diphosphate phosphatase [Candidatus Omnitrophica bacterium]|nr:undecaprenyl-diphosphate phosphatase [Candidatus Omnitrophota bacterium]
MESLLFGAVQGISEFLPISSSGHLYVLKRIIGLRANLLPFFVFLHLATLIAIGIFFAGKIKRVFSNDQLRLKILIITLITGFGALIIKIFLGSFFDLKYLVSFCFLANSFILLSKNKNIEFREINEVTLKDSLVLGLFQAIAVFPGISRSGITISILLKRGFRPQAAFDLSFIMAIPIIIIAFLVESKELFTMAIDPLYLASGFICAFIFGLVALKVLERVVLAKKLKHFGYYCLLAFVVSLIV